MRWWPRARLTLVSPMPFLECARRMAQLVAAPVELVAAPAPATPFEGVVEGRAFRIRRRRRVAILKVPSQPWIEGQIEPGSGVSVIRVTVGRRGDVAACVVLTVVLAVPALLNLVGAVAMCYAAWKLGPTAPWRCFEGAGDARLTAILVALPLVPYAAARAVFTRELRLALRLLDPIARPGTGPGRSLARG